MGSIWLDVALTQILVAIDMEQSKMFTLDILDAQMTRISN